MVNGARLLARHLTASGLSMRDFAAEVGTSASLVCMWAAGKRRPGVAFALRIERATNGHIRPVDWTRKERRRATGPRAAVPAPVSSDSSK
jgi:transcriptional regulator with XRE-family HTH domain